MTWSIDGKPLNSLLVSRLRYLGDVVMSTILLEVLRKGDPDLDIGYLCESAHGAVLANHPCLNRIHLLGVNRGGADAKARTFGNLMVEQIPSGNNTWGTFLQLKKQKYDTAVDLFFNPRSAWLLRFSGSRIRICGDAGSRRKLFTHSALRKNFTPSSNPTADSVLKRLAPGGLGEHLCRLAFLHHDPSGLDFFDWLDKTFLTGSLRPRLGHFTLGQQGAATLRSQGVVLDEPYLLAAPTATWQSKMMPVDLWRETLIQLHEATGVKILIITAPGNNADFQTLGSGSRVTVLEPMDLPDVLGLIQGAQALLSVDGGIMHAGVGMGVPTVGLFGPTDPKMWFPYEGLGPYRVLATRAQCSPCHLHHCHDFICMPQLQVPEMVAAVLAVLESESH